MPVQKKEGGEGEEDQDSDDIVFSAAPEELEVEEVLEALELAEVEEGKLVQFSFEQRTTGMISASPFD